MFLGGTSFEPWSILPSAAHIFDIEMGAIISVLMWNIGCFHLFMGNLHFWNYAIIQTLNSWFTCNFQTIIHFECTTTTTLYTLQTSATSFSVLTESKKRSHLWLRQSNVIIRVNLMTLGCLYDMLKGIESRCVQKFKCAAKQKPETRCNANSNRKPMTINNTDMLVIVES